MNAHQLLLRHADEAILLRAIELCDCLLERQLADLRTYKPKPTEIGPVVIEWNDGDGDPEWAHWNVYIQEDAEMYGIEGYPWAEVLSAHIDVRNGELPELDALVHFIWELTWYGPEGKVQELISDLNEQMGRIEAGEEILTSWPDGNKFVMKDGQMVPVED